MTDKEQKRVFSNNLNYLLRINQKSQKQVADALGILPQTFNSWCQGVSLPRMGKVQLLADYFGVMKSDLIEEKAAATSTEPASPSLPSDERGLLDKYRSLNGEGKAKLDERADELIQMGYTLEADIKKDGRRSA